jgi:hypothetical protein
MRARPSTITVSSTTAFVSSSTSACTSSSLLLLLMLLVRLIVAVVGTTKHGQFAAIAIDDNVKDILPECRLDLLGLREHNIRQNQSFILLPQSNTKEKTEGKKKRRLVNAISGTSVTNGAPLV